MNREFNDELLSAYLDGQLSGGDLATVEAELAANPEARHLLDELRLLSQQVRDLPRQSAGAEFADRVVRGALAAKADRNGQVQVAQREAATNHASSPNSVSPYMVRRGARLPVVLAGVAAVAAAVAMMVWPWLGGGLGLGGPAPGPGPGSVATGPGLNPDSVPAVASAAEAALAQLRQAIPQEGEVVVIRLRLGSDPAVAQAIDEALTAAGIGYRAASDDSTGAMQIAAAYRNELAAKFGGGQPGGADTALVEATIAAADAVFVEASWESLEKAVGALAARPEQAIDLCPLSKIAAALATGGNTAEGNGEGEGGSKGTATKPTATNYAQRLPAGAFRLEKTAAQMAATAAAPIDGKRKVRVLLLVEQVK